MTNNEARLVEALKAVIDAENRYKDGCSDERWTDAEMAGRKRVARDNGLALVKEMEAV